MGRLNGKSVILTGGAGDIAMAVASRFLSEGAKLLLVDLDESRLQRSCDALNNEAVKYCVADVTSESDTERYVNKAVAEFGGVDVLLANAGIEGIVAPISEYDTDVFEKVMSVNVTGAFLGLKHIFPVMSARGGGSIVITSSIAGIKGMPMLSAYNASKHAVIGLMRSCALEGAEHNIRVNTVNPAPVESRMIKSLEAGLMPDTPELAKETIAASVPLNRYAVPEDVANMMLFLASDESKFLTGGVYMVDGGQSAA
jgi:NAD(P)-dependent dehydrogenase (short-subunit alcohol dehydrogenase family)